MSESTLGLSSAITVAENRVAYYDSVHGGDFSEFMNVTGSSDQALKASQEVFALWIRHKFMALKARGISDAEILERICLESYIVGRAMEELNVIELQRQDNLDL